MHTKTNQLIIQHLQTQLPKTLNINPAYRPIPQNNIWILPNPTKKKPNYPHARIILKTEQTNPYITIIIYDKNQNPNTITHERKYDKYGYYIKTEQKIQLKNPNSLQELTQLIANQ